jgi:hypothetical protein
MAANEDLTGFIREALNRGLPRDEIRDVLSRADWSDEEVRAGLLSFAAVDFPIPVPRPRQIGRASCRERVWLKV